MSAKFIYSLSDDNKDLQKQIGCMNGILQLFDRHHFRGRRTVRHDSAIGENGCHKQETGNTPRKSTGQDRKKPTNDKTKNTPESPRTSISTSSCSSSLSSNTERFSSSKMTQEIATSKSSLNVIDIRDVVKDSIYREARGLSVKAGNKGESKGYTLKYMDSPRPISLNESLQVLAKLRQAPQNSNDGRDIGSLNVAPRFSYDERESQCRSIVKPKEIPRLSLDSKRSATAKKSNDNARAVLNQQKEIGSCKRQSSVVAKLMGLDALPEPIVTHRNQTAQIIRIEDDPFSRSSRRIDVNQQRLSGSPRSFSSVDSYKKNPVNSKFPVETAPWSRDSPTKPINPLSVYGEVEKRLTNLEFIKSGKDLRALKHILEAMQKSKEVLKSQALNFDSVTINNKSTAANQRGKQSNSQTKEIRGSNSPKILNSSIVIMRPAKLVEKDCSVIPKNSIPDLYNLRTPDSLDRTRELAERRAAVDRAPQANFKNPLNRPPFKTENKGRAKSTLTKETQQITRLSINPNKKLENVRQRKQQKKLEEEKQSHSIRKSSPRSPNFQLSDRAIGGMNQQSDTISLQSESNNSFVSRSETEVSSTDVSETTYITKLHTRKGQGGKPAEDSLSAKNLTALTEQPSPVSVLDSTFYNDDMPSPIKKISSAFADDEALDSEEVEWSMIHASELSSNRKSSFNNAFDIQIAENFQQLIQNIKQISIDQKELVTDETISLYDSKNPNHRYISQILSASGYLENPEIGIIKMQLHKSAHQINPNLFLALEHRNTRIGPSARHEKSQRKLLFDAVNEILASKLTQEISSKQWISPYKLGDKRQEGKQLLVELCSEIDRLQPNNLSCNLDDDYDDDSIKSILWADLMHQPENLTTRNSEISGLVLDVERLIFKDLINEILNDEGLSMSGKTSRHCSRQLFFI